MRIQELYLRRRYAEGYEVLVGNDVLTLEEAIARMDKQMEETGNEFLPPMLWERNFNR